MVTFFCWERREGLAGGLAACLYYGEIPKSGTNASKKSIVKAQQLSADDYNAIEHRDRKRYPSSIDLLAERYPKPEEKEE